MKEIINNKDNIQENEVTDLVKKVKVLLFNSNNEILLAHQYNGYEFPGGTHEEGEELKDTVKREIIEETGIKLDTSKLLPFACSISYYKDWPAKGRNKKIEIYYYEVKTNEKPNLDNINLTEKEKNGDFKLQYIVFDELEKLIKSTIELTNDPRGIGREMLQLIEIYKKIKE